MPDLYNSILAASVAGDGGGGGTEVIANPTLAGTEDELTGLQVGDTKYSVTSGISQADADARYLQLSGGTMTGSIKLSGNGQSIRNSLNNIFINASGYPKFGDSNSMVELNGNNTDVIHRRGGTVYYLLDTANTSANPTLSGGETALTSLKLNGVTYSVGGGKTLYRHSVHIPCKSDANIIATVINDDATAFTSETFKQYLIDNGYTHSQATPPESVVFPTTSNLWSDGSTGIWVYYGVANSSSYDGGRIKILARKISLSSGTITNVERVGVEMFSSITDTVTTL